MSHKYNKTNIVDNDRYYNTKMIILNKMMNFLILLLINLVTTTRKMPTRLHNIVVFVMLIPLQILTIALFIFSLRIDADMTLPSILCIYYSLTTLMAFIALVTIRKTPPTRKFNIILLTLLILLVLLSISGLISVFLIPDILGITNGIIGIMIVNLLYHLVMTMFIIKAIMNIQQEKKNSSMVEMKISPN